MYWRKLQQSGNIYALGGVMAKRLLTNKGITINPKYPDYGGIIADIQSAGGQVDSV